jgi:hypothetical protein
MCFDKFGCLLEKICQGYIPPLGLQSYKNHSVQMMLDGDVY